MERTERQKGRWSVAIEDGREGTEREMGLLTSGFRETLRGGNSGTISGLGINYSK